MMYLVSDYYATGEGRTICLLITRAYPNQDDYETEAQFDPYIPGTLKNSEKFRAAREFIEEFGAWYAQVAENLPKEEFMKKYGSYVPEVIQRMLESDAGNFNFKQRVHANYA